MVQLAIHHLYGGWIDHRVATIVRQSRRELHLPHASQEYPTVGAASPFTLKSGLLIDI